MWLGSVRAVLEAPSGGLEGGPFVHTCTRVGECHVGQGRRHQHTRSAARAVKTARSKRAQPRPAPPCKKRRCTAGHVPQAAMPLNILKGLFDAKPSPDAEPRKKGACVRARSVAADSRRGRWTLAERPSSLHHAAGSASRRRGWLRVPASSSHFPALLPAARQSRERTNASTGVPTRARCAALAPSIGGVLEVRARRLRIPAEVGGGISVFLSAVTARSASRALQCP
eukprot:356451-Chlamydomonas_euryale.AAC.3